MWSDFRKWQRKSVSLDSLSTSSGGGLMIAHEGNGTLLTSLANPIVNVGRMSASAVINTDAVDYEDEVILASGVRVGNYAKNPVVLWDHGKSVTTLPIGTSESPEGELDLVRSERMIEATTYFAQSFPFAAQVFGLIDEGVVRATSIHVIPTAIASYMAPDGRKVMVTEESDMVEYSWTCLGVNPEAVRRQKSLSLPDRYREAWSLQVDRAASVLRRGTLGGDVLSPSIRKSLTAMAKPKGMLINPFSDEQDGQDMTKKTLTAPELRRMSRAKLKSLRTDDYDDETQAQMKALIGDEEEVDESEFADDFEADDEEAVDPEFDDEFAIDDEGTAPVDDAEPFEGEDEDEAVPKPKPKSVPAEGEEVPVDPAEVEPAPAGEESLDDGAMKLGAKVLKEAHDAIDYVVKYLEEALGPVENEPVKVGLMAELQHLTECVDTVRGLYTAAYPGAPALGVDPQIGEEDVLATQMKSMLASDERRQYRALGIQSLVSQVTRARNLTTKQRKSLLAVEEKISRMLESAASYKPEAPVGYVPVAQYESLESKLGELMSKFEALALPASR